MNNERRVVITGCGIATPLGIGVDAYWEALLAGQSGVAPIKAFDASGFDSILGAEVPEFKIRDYVPKNYRKSTKVMARDIELAVVCAFEAAKDAGLRTKCLIDCGVAEGSPSVDSTRFGANIGAGLICADLQELAGALSTSGDVSSGKFDLKAWGESGMDNLTPLWLLKFLPNMLGCHVTIVHDCQAPSNTITCGEASGHLAIGEAYRTIARGAADVCICGGAESRMNPMGLMRQHLAGRVRLGADDTPESAVRPFDPTADGMAVGEGGGLLILEELEFAKARGARVYAEVAGFGGATNISDHAKPEPDGEGIALAAGNALRDAGVSADDVDLYVAFGTGCAQYDASELAAGKTIFGKRTQIPAVAVKGALGNVGAGAGAIDVATAAMAVHHNTIPPSINTQSGDADQPFAFASGDPVDAKVTTALSVGYALSGSQIAALVLKKWVG